MKKKFKIGMIPGDRIGRYAICAARMGVVCSGSIGDSMGIIEPIQGTAPKYAGKM